MSEMSRYHWFEVPVYATLRVSCCPSHTVEVTKALTCDSPGETIDALAAATSSHAPIDDAISAYKKVIQCFVARGEQGLFGETDVVHSGDEAAFRAFAARGKPAK